MQATDDEGKGQSTVVPLKISLIDSNDNAPVFTSEVYRAIIDEGATKFEPPLQVQVVFLLSHNNVNSLIVKVLTFTFWYLKTNNKSSLHVLLYVCLIVKINNTTNFISNYLQCKQENTVLKQINMVS